ncbi:enoyl-CoA hydratase [Dichotomopilus funicola]|uniref:Enoyl-CoA hydratase n=1 Tax=Dichotomopilus funicola TaxID=1934379 RepID=A0AAN6V233_9PEZI|nr:enoyl-CoA hydratase [Dichotomopilus funicola]
MSEQPPRSTLVQRSTPHPGVAVLAFNRPEKRNALSQSLIDEFLSELATVSADHAIKAVILTGGPHFFSAGADINEISRLDFESARGCRYLEDLCNGMAAVRKPVIAAVEGMALGGGFEVALMCDLIFASEITKFGLPEVRIGLIPGAGGTQRLTNAVGKYQAMKMILFGATITGQEALSNGLVTELSPPGSVLDRAIKAAQQLASLSSSAVQLAKEAVCRSDKLGRDDEFERSLYYSAFGTAHKREGVSAFLEKRSPDWDSSGA